MATTRLRQTFKYPTDSSGSEGSRDELDEEEQETLIINLRTKEADQNSQYTLIFTLLPLTVVLPFVIYIPSSSPRIALLCLLSITSLLSTAYTIRYLPSKPENAVTKRGPLYAPADSPVEMYLPYLNAAIASLLIFASWALKGKSSAPEGLWAFFLLPGVMFGMVMMARKSMADVEAGIGELSRMKYDYKGA